MPIAGMTDQQENFGSGFPEIARLHKGAPKNDKGYVGKDLDYFRVEFAPEFEYLAPVWQELYGDKPSEFQPVYLARPTVDTAFETWMVAFNASNAMQRKCTGEQLIGTRHPSTGTWIEDTGGLPCLCAQEKAEAERAGKLAQYKPACQRSGRLNLVLPEFVEASGVLGYVSVHLKSFYDIMAVYRTLTELERLTSNLTGIGLIFGRAKRTVSVPNPKQTGKRMKVTKSLIYMRPTAEFTKQTLLPALASPQAAQPQLPAPPERISDRIGFTTEQAREAFGASGSRRIGRNMDAPTGDMLWTPIDRLLVTINEEGDYLYQLVMRDDSVILRDTDAYPFIQAGIESADSWDYPNEVEFDPPLMVQYEEHQGDRWLTRVQTYDGDIAVDLGQKHNPFLK